LAFHTRFRSFSREWDAGKAWPLITTVFLYENRYILALGVDVDRGFGGFSYELICVRLEPWRCLVAEVLVLCEQRVARICLREE
jgi:hypothetical protein